MNSPNLLQGNSTKKPQQPCASCSNNNRLSVNFCEHCGFDLSEPAVDEINLDRSKSKPSVGSRVLRGVFARVSVIVIG